MKTGSTAGAEALGRWPSRPILAGLVRLLSFAFTVGASIAAAVTAARLLPQPAGGVGLLAWWLTLLLGAMLAGVVADRLSRRVLLPLAALLKLSLVFPGRAPSRAGVALRTATVRHARRRLEDFDPSAFSEDPFRAAVMVIALVGAMTSHCRCTRGHSERVRAFGDLLADQLRLAPDERDRLRWAALLHDVGKLHVSPRILNKPGSPTSEEWEAIRRHPEQGARIAAPLRGWLGPWADAIEQHHERWDGNGYPNGLAGEDISLGARVVAVADAFDVMTAARPYQRPVGIEQARQELVRCAAGTQFDPAVVRAFLNIPRSHLRKVVSPVAWAAQLPLFALVPRVEVAAAVAREAVTTLGAVTAISVLGATGAIHGRPAIVPPSVVAALPASPSTSPSAPVDEVAATAAAEAAVVATPPRPPAAATPHGVDDQGSGERRLTDRLPVSLPQGPLAPADLSSVDALISDISEAVPPEVVSSPSTPNPPSVVAVVEDSLGTAPPG